MLTSSQEEKAQDLGGLVVCVGPGQCVQCLGMLVRDAVNADYADCCVTLSKLFNFSEPHSCTCKMGITKVSTF